MIRTYPLYHLVESILPGLYLQFQMLDLFRLGVDRAWRFEVSKQRQSVKLDNFHSEIRNYIALTSRTKVNCRRHKFVELGYRNLFDVLYHLLGSQYTFSIQYSIKQAALEHDYNFIAQTG